jgi:hypothetical protein
MDSRREFDTHLDPFAAVNADVRDVDVLFVGESDSITPVGTKGVGTSRYRQLQSRMRSIATGTRVRSLPISIGKVLGQQATSAGNASRLDAMARTTSSASICRSGALAGAAAPYHVRS